MNELMKWVDSQESAQQFKRTNLTRIIGSDEPIVPNYFKTPNTNKLLALKFPNELNLESSLNPNHSTILGGMCLLTTIDMKKMAKKEITFNSTNQFETWFKSWYPRIDQIHDTVGTPPNICPKIIYVSEDSFFADRISSYTGLKKGEVQSILHETHQEQGHPTLKRYLKNQGYKGQVDVIYTSEVEKDLDISLRIWERIMGTNFRGGDRNFAKVELMYTGFWLDILNLQDSGIIFEAANKLVLKGWLKLENWYKDQQYGTGINKNLGIAGYLPFLTTRGDSAVVSCNEVPNYSNYKTYNIPEEEILWYITNLLYRKKTVTEKGPSAISTDDAKNMIRFDLTQYFEEEK